MGYIKCNLCDKLVQQSWTVKHLENGQSEQYCNECFKNYVKGNPQKYKNE